MLQKDYVKRGRTNLNSYSCRKKINKEWKKITFFIVIIILVIFIEIYYCITRNKYIPEPNNNSLNKTNKDIDNLPHKPEEQWRYIKELENQCTKSKKI
ncbi:MAG: hypothetical protein ACEY29_00265 [Arsenophonus sp.]